MVFFVYITIIIIAIVVYIIRLPITHRTVPDLRAYAVLRCACTITRFRRYIFVSSRAPSTSVARRRRVPKTVARVGTLGSVSRDENINDNACGPRDSAPVLLPRYVISVFRAVRRRGKINKNERKELAFYFAVVFLRHGFSVDFFFSPRGYVGTVYHIGVSGSRNVCLTFFATALSRSRARTAHTVKIQSRNDTVYNMR